MMCHPWLAPASMPGMVDSTKNNCHCIACCSCSPRDRLSGVCPAFTFSRNTLAASLDTGLDHLDGNGSNECLVRSAALMTSEVRDSGRAAVPEFGSEAACGIDVQAKYKSLPLYYSRTWCMVCGKVTASSGQNFPFFDHNEKNNRSDVVNKEGFVQVCKCKGSNVKFDNVTSSLSQQQQRIIEVITDCKRPTSKQWTNKVSPLEYKSRLDVRIYQ